jgi:hypothetical protein
MSVADADLERALAELETLDRAALAARWVIAFGRPAPFKCRATLLRSGLAWHLQLRAPAGKPPSLAPMLRLLRSAQNGTAALTSGTTLMREWNGVTHHVRTLAKGYEYQGKTYASLSAVARRITGTAWSGPGFFGTRK